MSPHDILHHLHRSGLEHDSCTGENNNGYVINLELAVQLLHEHGLLNEYEDKLRKQYQDIPEYEWLVPAHGYIDVEGTDDAVFVFELLKVRGYTRAAATVQNVGRVALADFHAALEEIEATGEKGQHPANVYRNYINEHAVLGKDA